MPYGIIQIHKVHVHLNTVWYHTAFMYIETLGICNQMAFLFV